MSRRRRDHHEPAHEIVESRVLKVGRARDVNKVAFDLWLDSSLCICNRVKPARILSSILEFAAGVQQFESLDTNVRCLVALLAAASQVEITPKFHHSNSRLADNIPRRVRIILHPYSCVLIFRIFTTQVP